VDFKNTIVIMTSNVGAHRITHQDDFGFGKRDANISYDKMKETLKTELEGYFRPEFLNRLDEIIVFRKLTHDDMIGIVDLELKKLGNRMREKGFELLVQQDAKDFLIENGTDEKFGARPLRRAIEHYLEDALSEAMLRGEFAGRKKVSVTVAPPEAEGEKSKALKLEAAPDEERQLEAVGAVADGT
jgi:ATP-dependent Clp protease ATP-binding subunit ClpC